MQNLLIEVGGLVASVWAATEIIGRIVGVDKARLALGTGPAFTVAAQYLGWVDVGDGVQGYVAAALLGLLAITPLAGLANDKVAKPAQPKKQ